MPSCVRIEMFGGLRIVAAQDGAPIEVPPHRAGILLALLALQPCRSITREELIDNLWPEDGDQESRRRLRQTLHELRAILDQAAASGSELIDSNRASIQLKAELLSTDVMEFETAATGARNLTLDLQLNTLRTAVDLYKGGVASRFLPRLNSKRTTTAAGFTSRRSHGSCTRIYRTWRPTRRGRRAAALSSQ